MRKSIPIGITLAVLLATASGLSTAPPAPDLIVSHLLVDGAADPIGIDAAPPRLSWRLESDARGQRQTAYRVLVASSRAALDKEMGDLWDSGQVASDATLSVPYGGRPLASFQRAWWKVRAWDKDERPSLWSAPASWTMGILAPADWRASWIGAPAGAPPTDAMLLRRTLTIRPALVRALVFVCGLGVYEMTVNGRRVGEDLLTPEWTKYDKTCLYDAYDATPLLKAGQNGIGLHVANGFFNVRGGRYTKYKGSFGPIKAIALLRLEYASGAVEYVGTDASWRHQASPMTFSCMYGGEDYDARLEQRGWDGPGFDDAGWAPAAVIAGPGGAPDPRSAGGPGSREPGAALRGASFAAPPVRAAGRLKPAAVREIGPGIAVYDLGQNAPVMLTLEARGPAGSSVRVTPAELVKADGTADRQSVGGGDAYWQYTLAGRGREAYTAKFFYHGARYLQVERRPAAEGGARSAGGPGSREPGGTLPEVLSLEGVIVHTSSAPIGDFACSNDLFNRIRTLVRWAQRANLTSLITDCPHRERLGWLEQYHLNGPSLRYEWDLGRLFAKTMADMADSQLTDGLVPDIAPEYTVFSGGFRDSPEWGSAYVLVPWQQYEWTGDLDLLRRHYEGMARYVDYLASKAKGGIVSHGLGDWYDLGPKPPGEAQLTPKALTATAFYHEDTRVLGRAAALLGRTEDAKRYAARAEGIRAAFNKAFLDPATGTYAGGSQAGNAIPLVMGLVPEERRAAVLEAIVADVKRHGDALTAGDVGYRYLLRALADGGRSDVVFALNSRSDRPGYGYQLAAGATSLTEAWDAGRGSSQNHFMLGHIMEWFYRDLAGIGCDPSGPGYKIVSIRPQPVGDVTWARASLDSVRGKIGSSWRIERGMFKLEATIPPGATARVHMPAASAAGVTEGGLPAAGSPGVAFTGLEGGRAIFTVGSGRYVFECPWR